MSTVNKLLLVVLVALAGLFVAQLSVSLAQKPGTQAVASWRNSPDTLEQAVELSDDIVRGRVTRVRRAEDIVVQAAGEPDGEVRIPVEAVTIQLERTLKGGPKERIQVFHTGLSKGDSAAEKGAPREDPPPRPDDGVDRPRRLPRPSIAESRTFLLEGDPPYKSGDRVVLFLTEGPALEVDGETVQTMAIVAPEGRYAVDDDEELDPVIDRKFADEQRGKPLREFEEEVEEEVTAQASRAQ
jgi:hypothetical protein